MTGLPAPRAVHTDFASNARPTWCSSRPISGGKCTTTSLVPRRCITTHFGAVSNLTSVATHLCSPCPAAGMTYARNTAEAFHCLTPPSSVPVHTHIASPDDPLVESLFRIKIASKTSHARWLSWVSTSSFSSIASGRGECRDSHITTKPTHSYNSAHHTYIYVERPRAPPLQTPVSRAVSAIYLIHRFTLAPAEHTSRLTLVSALWFYRLWATGASQRNQHHHGNTQRDRSPTTQRSRTIRATRRRSTPQRRPLVATVQVVNATSIVRISHCIRR
jgi:hypothetical protein